MGMGSQFSLDLDDRKQYIEKFVKDYKLYSGQSLHVDKDHEGNFRIMERVRGPVETDYYYLLKIDREEAEWLVSNEVGGKRITEWMDCLK